MQAKRTSSDDSKREPGFRDAPEPGMLPGKKKAALRKALGARDSKAMRKSRVLYGWCVDASYVMHWCTPSKYLYDTIRNSTWAHASMSDRSHFCFNCRPGLQQTPVATWEVTYRS